MKTAIITVKTNPLIKSRAQKMAKDLGLALSFVFLLFGTHSQLYK